MTWTTCAQVELVELVLPPAAALVEVVARVVVVELLELLEPPQAANPSPSTPSSIIVSPANRMRITPPVAALVPESIEAGRPPRRGSAGETDGIASSLEKTTDKTDKELDMAADAPVLDTLVAITAASVERCDLEPRELMLARIAALAAVGAPPASYLANAGTASDVGITLEDVQGVLIGIAPVVGTPRTVSAAANIARALGFAIAAAETELEAEAG